MSVIVWALAAVAIVAAIASGMMSSGYGANALVTTGKALAAEAPPAPEPLALPDDPAEFRRPAPVADGRPRVAIIVRNLGLSAAATRRAIADLPPDISLALSAYGRDLQRDADDARAVGHEVFLDVPVEPQGYPANDAGPQALLTSLSPAENVERLRWSLGRFHGYPGVVFASASPATDNAATVTPLLTAPGAGGLIWAHAGARGFETAKAELAAAALSLEAGLSAREADMALERLEALARKNGGALAIVTPSPVTLDRLAAWSASLDDRGVALVPASALAVTPGS